VSLPDALVFDCDGVIAETERDGHRVSFNQAFAERDIPAEWSVERYGELLAIGGGKERMKADFEQNESRKPFESLQSDDDRWNLLKELHSLKTDKFLELVDNGQLPLRSGILRIVREAYDAGVPVAVCSTSNERAVQGIVSNLIPEPYSSSIRIFAGDAVKAKKPSPDVYNLAASELKLEPFRTVVVEDAQIGVQAAKSAGMLCVVTKSVYTQDEDFSSANAVLDTLGDDNADDCVHLGDLTVPKGRFWSFEEKKETEQS
jgi:HAD superfamily hydrolase (TIGR01509 family)